VLAQPGQGRQQLPGAAPWIVVHEQEVGAERSDALTHELRAQLEKLVARQRQLARFEALGSDFLPGG